MMHTALHPRDDLDRLYMSRIGGERGLASIEDSVIQSLYETKQRKANYSNRKQLKQNKNQQKTTVRTFQATNKQNLTQGQLRYYIISSLW